jgi:hypothetical protein
MFCKNRTVDGHLWKSQVLDSKCQNSSLKVSSNILLFINVQDEDFVIFPYTRSVAVGYFILYLNGLFSTQREVIQAF